MIQTGNNISGIKSVSTHDMVSALGKRKWLYLSVLFIVGSISFLILKYQIFTYTSQASFYMSETGTGVNTGQNQEFIIPTLLTPTEQYERAFKLMNSSNVHEHIIKKFNLLKHYNIDTSNEFYYEEAIAILQSRMQINKSPNQLIVVSISDRHRYLAADMANEAVNYLDELNKKTIINTMKQKLNIYEKMLVNTEADNNSKRILFDKQLAELNQSLGRLDNRSLNSPTLLNLQSQLNQLISSLQRSSEEIIRMRVNYSLALQSIQELNLPSVVIIHKARPSYVSIALRSLFVSLVIMFIVFSGIVYSVYFKLRYKNYIKALWYNGKHTNAINIEHKEPK